MVNYSTNLESWGATGTLYPSGYSYEEGEQPVDAWDNFVAYNIITDIEHLISLTNDRIESDTENDRPNSPEDGHQSYDGDTGALEWYDGIESTWEEVLPKSGGQMTGDLDFDGNAIEDSSGTLDIDTETAVQGGNLAHDWYMNQQGGTVADGAIVPIGTFELEGGDTLAVTQAMLTEDGFTTPAADGVELIIVFEDDTTVQILAGDGSTLYADESGSPIVGAGNTSGSSQVAMIGIDNGDYTAGSGADQTVYAGYTARIF